jgi:hypothetical protein
MFLAKCQDTFKVERHVSTLLAFLIHALNVYLDYSAASQHSLPHTPRPSESRNFSGTGEYAEAYPLLPQQGYPPAPQNHAQPPFAITGGSYAPSAHPSPSSPPPQHFGPQTGYPYPLPPQSNQMPFSPTQDYRESSPYGNGQPSFNYHSPSHSPPPLENSNLPTSNHALAASGYVPAHMLNPQPFSVGDNFPPPLDPPDYEMEPATYTSSPQQSHPSSLLPS